MEVGQSQKTMVNVNPLKLSHGVDLRFSSGN